MTANLPEVGAAQAADFAGPAFAAIWAEAAVSITFHAQMCQTSHQSSAGYISRATANCFNRVWKHGAGYCERGFWGQWSASCPHDLQHQQADRLRIDCSSLLHPLWHLNWLRLCRGHTVHSHRQVMNTSLLQCPPPHRSAMPGTNGIWDPYIVDDKGIKII